ASDRHVVLDRSPEIAAEGSAEPFDVLDENGAVEAHRAAQRRRRFRARLRAHDEEGGVPRQHPDDGEDQPGDDEERGAPRHAPAEDQLAHRGEGPEVFLDGPAPRGTPGWSASADTMAARGATSTSSPPRGPGPAWEDPSRCPGCPSSLPPGAGRCRARRPALRRP